MTPKEQCEVLLGKLLPFAESQLKKDNVQDELLRKKRIDNLKVQLEKIEEYSEKLEAFRLLAEKHLGSKNLLTITPRELNFNRLRNWSMMIDPTESDDPYAQRIYVQVKCKECDYRFVCDIRSRTYR